MTGTSVATRPEPKAQLVAGGDVAAIIPRTIEETFRLAGAISASGMAPQSLGTPEKVMVAIMAGAELGLAPFQSLQSFAVINGKPAIWGDGLMAVVRANGFKIKEWIEGDGDDMVARCEITRPDNGDVAAGEFSVADAKKASLWNKQGPWQQYPKRMLKMRARAFALRDGAADVLRGFQIREEVEDYQHVREVRPAEGTGMRARLEARTPTGGFDADHLSSELDRALDGDAIPSHDPETGEIIDAEVEAPEASQAAEFTAAPDTPANTETLTSDSPEPATAPSEPELPAGLKTGRDLLEEQQAAAPEFDHLSWAADLNRDVESMTLEEIDRLVGDPTELARFEDLKAKHPAIAKQLDDAIGKRRKALS